MSQPTSPQGQASNPYNIPLYPVEAPSGSELNLQTTEEAAWYESRRDRYLTENKFTMVSDLQDLDRLLLLEVLVYRWGLWMSQGFDYMYSRVDEGQLKNNIQQYSVEIRLLKQSLGIDKATRNKDQAESLSDYVANLLERAKTFGYHRNEQYELVVTKFYELASMIATFDRCDEEERAMLDLSHESIFAWIREYVLQPFNEHSEAFRKNQSMWVRSL